VGKEKKKVSLKKTGKGFQQVPGISRSWVTGELEVKKKVGALPGDNGAGIMGFEKGGKPWNSKLTRDPEKGGDYRGDFWGGA